MACKVQEDSLGHLDFASVIGNGEHSSQHLRCLYPDHLNAGIPNDQCVLFIAAGIEMFVRSHMVNDSWILKAQTYVFTNPAK